MIRKILHKLFCWVRDYGSEEPERGLQYATVSSRKSRRGSHSDELSSNGMTFNLYAAEGGTVIETRFYDSKNDENTHRLYIISDGEDFSNVLGQIVSLERMKTWH